MSDDARAVWVEGADPTLVCSDDILDLAKIVGDVESVKLQYHSERRSVFYRVMFKHTSSAQAFLHLEGTRFKDCVLHLSSSVFGSIEPPAPIVQDSSHREDKKFETVATTSGNHPQEFACLPFFNDFGENFQLDKALIPSYELLCGVVANWKDPENSPLPTGVTQDDVAFLASTFGLAELCPVLDEFAELQNRAGQTLRLVSELKARKAENEAAMEKLLKERNAFGVQRNSAGLECSASAERAKRRRIRNAVAVPSSLSHPLTLLLTLATVCGPVTQYHVTNSITPSRTMDQHGAPFHICVEFMTESCASRALTMLNGTYAPPSRATGSRNAAIQRSTETAEDISSDASAIASLGILRGMLWDTVQYPFPVPADRSLAEDETAKKWADAVNKRSL
jgi:hypothetical protein